MSRNGRFRSGSEVDFAGNSIAMKLCMECSLDLTSRTFEHDPAPSMSNRFNREALGFEPPNDLIDQLRARAKPIGKLFWGKPSMIAERRRILQLFQKYIECPLLLRCASEDEGQRRQVRAADDTAEVSGMANRRIRCASKHDR